MIFTPTSLAGAVVIDVEPKADSRGLFARTFCAREFVEHGLDPAVAQASVSVNARKGTVRGLHFQYPPHAETKLVRCVRGAILDVIVDLRPESSTYLQHVAVELSAENRRSLYVPRRFAHGFQVLADDTEVTYLIGEFYSPDAQGGLHHADPALGIAWPLAVTELSDRDVAWPLLAAMEPELRASMAPPVD